MLRRGHHRPFRQRFRATATSLGFAPRAARLQWPAVTKVAALAGAAPDQLTGALIDDGQAALTVAIGRHRPGGPGAAHLAGALSRARTVLFHPGVLDTLPGRHPPDRQAARDAARASVPSRLA